jgi:hypothetical protein
MLYSRVKRFGLLQTFATDRSFQLVAGQKSLATLVALQAVHLAFWFPTSK